MLIHRNIYIQHKVDLKKFVKSKFYYKIKTKNSRNQNITSPAFASPNTISSIKTQFITFIFELFTVLWNEMFSDRVKVSNRNLGSILNFFRNVFKKYLKISQIVKFPKLWIKRIRISWSFLRFLIFQREELQVKTGQLIKYVCIPKFCKIFEVNYFLSSYLLKKVWVPHQWKVWRLFFELSPLNSLQVNLWNI